MRRGAFRYQRRCSMKKPHAYTHTHAYLHTRMKYSTVWIKCDENLAAFLENSIWFRRLPLLMSPIEARAQGCSCRCRREEGCEVGGEMTMRRAARLAVACWSIDMAWGEVTVCRSRIRSLIKTQWDKQLLMDYSNVHGHKRGERSKTTEALPRVDVCCNQTCYAYRSAALIKNPLAHMSCPNPSIQKICFNFDVHFVFVILGRHIGHDFLCERLNIN